MIARKRSSVTCDQLKNINLVMTLIYSEYLRVEKSWVYYTFPLNILDVVYYFPKFSSYRSTFDKWEVHLVFKAKHLVN